jgi:hypothetical protein
MKRSLTSSIIPLLMIALAGAASRAEEAKPTPAPKPPQAKPGVIAGVVSDERGNVIKDARIRVFVSGISGSFGQRNEFNYDVGEDGAYSFEMPDGVYKIWAEVEKEYNGRQYRLQLYPEDKRDWNAGHSTKNGVVKNFVWKVSGLKPGGDRKMPSAYYGGTITFQDKNHYDDEKKLLGKYPKANVVLTFTPRGPLVDGSTVKPFDREFPVKAFQQYSGQILDVPIGEYSVSARVVTPEKNQVPLKVRKWNPAASDEENPMAAKADFEFAQPSTVESMQEVKMQLGLE